MTTEISADPIGPEDLPAIERVLASVRPAIEADGGIVQLAGTRGDTVILRLGSKCMGSIQSGETLGTIRRALMHTLGKVRSEGCGWSRDF